MTTLTSPVGTIVFMAVDAPRANKYKENQQEYLIKLKFDASATEWKQQIMDINPKIVVDSDDGGFCVKASSLYAPTVTDQDGKVLNREEGEVPSFGTGATGTAIMTVTVYEGKRGNSINLKDVGIVSLTAGSSEGNAAGTSLNALREALKVAKS